MPLITPPFRTSLLTANGVPFATDNGDIQTTRDWWMYWNQLTEQGNSNSKLATEGTHANRPLPESMPDGALYYESDRGVLYSNANGTWQYVAGTMWGTAGGPDQRPTDLGAADVGFDFRTNVSPAREFIWSGGRWIEVTPMLYGTHAQRLAGTIAGLWAGMAWMETDRGNVIYQNQSFLWIYVAGVMVAALASQPTDLGINDAGFRFESTDTRQSFRWSGSAWVVTALVDPTTTKGDLIARGAAAPATRLGVGTDGQILTADSTQTLGVKWGTPGTPSQWTNVAGGIVYSGGTVGIGSAASTDQLEVNTGNQCIYAGGGIGIGKHVGGGYQLQLSSDFAQKATSSTWAVASSRALKKNIRPLTGGLDIIQRLEPIEAQYNGLAGTLEDARVVSLIAEDVEPVLPGCVHRHRRRLRTEDAEETEILDLNPHEILFQLILAVKQLSDQVNNLRLPAQSP